MEKTRTSGLRLHKKKVTDHEWRVSSTGLCGTTLCASRARREGPDIRTGLCQPSEDIAAMLCSIKRGRTVKSSNAGEKGMCMERQLPTSIKGEQRNILTNGKKSSKWTVLEMAKNKEVRRHGLGQKKESSKEIKKLPLLL